MSILINRFNLRLALHQTNLSPDIADMLTDKIADLIERDKAKKLEERKDVNCFIVGKCSICKEPHNSSFNLINETVFCRKCGHRIDWSE